VTFDSTVYCGKCYFCRRGAINLCDNRRVLGVSCGDYRQNGAFAEYVAVPQHILYRLPDGLSFERAALVEPLAIAVHCGRAHAAAAQRHGAGGRRGHGRPCLSSRRCASPAAARSLPSTSTRGRLDLARRLGADVGLRPDTADVKAEVQRRTHGRGADAGFEVVGIGPAVQTALAGLRKGASLTLVGNLAASIEFPLQAAVTREITLYGSCASTGDTGLSRDDRARADRRRRADQRDRAAERGGGLV